MDQEIPEEYKERVRKRFELAAQKGKWLLYGGKIVISIEKPKPGKLRLVRATTILEDVIEI